jgi:hypothetical protein
MIYVKLNTDNTIEYAKNVYTTDEGELILNFKANPELMKQYGFKELIDSPVELFYQKIKLQIKTKPTLQIQRGFKHFKKQPYKVNVTLVG